MLKVIFTSVLLSCASLFAQNAQTLSEVDRQLSLDRLKEIQEAAKENDGSRFGTAISAFRSAMASESAAHALFLQCSEKLLFTDEAKKASEYRDWRKNHRDRRDSPAFRKALRHQLAWLVLLMDVSKKPDEIQSFAPRAMTLFNAVLADHEKLAGAQGILRQGVLGTVFAQAYNVGNLEVGKFPKNPLAISEIFEEIVFPPLRKIERTSDLRASWKKRIKFEGRLVKEWGREGTKGRRPEFEKWYFKARLDLLWAMELDLYKVGDQRKATRTMLEFLERNVHHTNAPKWIQSLESLLKGQEPKEAPKPKKEKAE